LVDELHLTVCPQIFGGRNAPTVADGKGFFRLADASQFELKSLKRFENEMFAVFSRKK
jgi:5-amino-6-(5-phosphoribosylamino)uracil reductase